MAEPETDPCMVVSCCLAVLSLIFNSLGIYLLYEIKTCYANQILILINLSISEIIISVGWLAEETIAFIGFTYADRATQIVWALRAGAYCFWFIDMCLMAIDRWFGCNFPLKHRAFASTRKASRILQVTWLLCLANSIFLLIVDTEHYHQIYNRIVWFVFDCVSVVIFAIAYSSISYYLFFKRRKVFRSRRVANRNFVPVHRNQHFLRVASLIIFTYLIFEVCPTTIIMVYFQNQQDIEEPLASILDMCYVIAIFIDPLIYIFLQGRIRRLLVRKIQCRGSRESSAFSPRVAVILPLKDFVQQSYLPSLHHEDTKL